MRCKKHLPDLTSTIGVCASCLRERLKVLEAQAQAQAQDQQARSSSSEDGRRCFEKPEPDAPPLNFPRSVSPYVARRKSDSDRRREKLFHHTPQAGAGETASSRKKLGRLWILSSIFRFSRSNKTENSSRESCDEPSPSSSPWFSTILRQKNHRRRCRNPDRGASPAVTVTDHLGAEFDGRDRSDSGCLSKSSPQRRNHTTEVTQRRSRLGPAGKSLTNMAFCLSPMVRASPNRNWSHKGMVVQEMGGVHHISNATSFCANRSRKIADFGRVGNNR